MAKDNLTKSENLDVTAREVDFVTRFGLTWQALLDILGIMRPIKKAPGTVLKSKYAELTLQSGDVGEGEEVPYSLATVKEKDYATIQLEKYAKAVSIEAIDNHGYDVAVSMTDDQFLYELTDIVMTRFYAYLNTGTLTATETSFKRALAMARGYVINRFKEMKRVATKIVAFVNVLDVYDYLGDVEITVQNQFGFDYIKNFMGYDTVFLVSDNEIARGTVIALPVENIVLYYVDPSTSDFSKAGLSYTVDGVTPLIGFHTQGNYKTVVSECFALMGLTLFAEYLDAICVMTVSTAATTSLEADSVDETETATEVDTAD